MTFNEIAEINVLKKRFQNIGALLFIRLKHGLRHAAEHKIFFPYVTLVAAFGR